MVRLLPLFLAIVLVGGDGIVSWGGDAWAGDERIAPADSTCCLQGDSCCGSDEPCCGADPAPSRPPSRTPPSEAKGPNRPESRERAVVPTGVDECAARIDPCGAASPEFPTHAAWTRPVYLLDASLLL